MAKVTLMVEAETDAYGPEETAKLLGKGEATIWRWLRDGKILAVKVGGRTLIPEKEIERLKKELGLPDPDNR
jgi:excisionase family DNA binding protein